MLPGLLLANRFILEIMGLELQRVSAGDFKGKNGLLVGELGRQCGSGMGSGKVRCMGSRPAGVSAVKSMTHTDQ